METTSQVEKLEKESNISLTMHLLLDTATGIQLSVVKRLEMPLANHKAERTRTRSQRKSARNRCKRVMIGFEFFSDWLQEQCHVF